jgi:hypothetical protein
MAILADDKSQKVEIGKVVKQELEKAGLRVEWNNDSESRLNLKNFDWKRRTDI